MRTETDDTRKRVGDTSGGVGVGREGLGVVWGVVGGAAVGGVGAGWLARVVLGRLREPVRLPVGVAEAAVGLVWAVVAARAVAGGMPGWWVPAPAALGWLAVVLTATDLAQRRLPNVITMPAYPVAGALLVVVCGAGGGAGLGARAVVAGALLLVVYATVHLAAPGQLGAGDVKLAGVVGLVLGAMGWPAVVVGQVIAAVVTAGFAVGPVGRRRGSPHGPGMLAGALLLAVFPGTVAAGG